LFTTKQFIILPVATPTKATYYAGKLSSHTTRFTFFILYYQHISQVFMYTHNTTTISMLPYY